jgi:hypothetical protein
MFIAGGYTGKILIRKMGVEMALKILLIGFGVVGVVASTLIFDVTSLLPLLISFSVIAGACGAHYPIRVNSALQEFTQDATKAPVCKISCRSVFLSVHRVSLLYGHHWVIRPSVGPFFFALLAYLVVIFCARKASRLKLRLVLQHK